MLPSAKSALGALGAATALTLAPAARAGEAHPMRVEYHAPSSCPDEAAFVSRVRARVDLRAPQPGETVPTFGVTLLAEGNRVIGRIASVNERSEPTSRVVTGTDCSDVADAVALVVAMSLSPSAGAALSTNSQTRAKVDPTADPLPDAKPPERDAPTANPAPGNTPEPRRFKLLASATAEAAIGYLDTTLFAPGARLQLFRTSAYVGGPSLAVGFAAIQPTERQMADGRATVSFNLGELFACPISFALSQAVTVLPCARLDLGQVKAAGSDIAGAKSDKRLWSTAGVLGQIVLVPVKPLVIDAQASFLVPLTPYTFVFSPYSVIYPAPGVAFSASLAVGVMFL